MALSFASHSSFTGPTNCTSSSASPRSGASFAASDGRRAGSTGPPASTTSRMSSRRAGSGALQVCHVVAGRLDQREVVVARHHARVRARERELSAGRIRHHEQVRGGIRARRFGAREGRSGDQAAEGGCCYSQMTNTREVDTEPFPAQGRRLRELSDVSAIREKTTVQATRKLGQSSRFSEKASTRPERSGRPPPRPSPPPPAGPPRGRRRCGTSPVPSSGFGRIGKPADRVPAQPLDLERVHLDRDGGPLARVVVLVDRLARSPRGSSPRPSSSRTRAAPSSFV